MNMKKTILILALALAACLAFTACGGSGSSAAGSSSAGASSSAGTSAGSSSESDESDLAYVEGKGTLIIGYTVYAPMSYTDDDGAFTGFDTELAEALCEKLGVTPEFVEINWDTKEIELSSKGIDCIWNGLTITDERKANMAVTEPYVQNAQVVVMKTEADYTDTASLIGKAVCAEAGSAGEEAVQEDENLAQADYVAKDVQTACLMEVSAGTADAAVLDLTLANAMIGEGTDYAGLEIKDRLAIEYYGVAFRKGSDLCDKANELLAGLLEDGTTAALAEKYGLDVA